jgi:hypothetical protein
MGNRLFQALTMVGCFTSSSCKNNVSIALTYPASCEQSAGLSNKFVNKRLTPLPQVNGDVKDIADETECCEWTV